MRRGWFAALFVALLAAGLAVTATPPVTTAAPLEGLAAPSDATNMDNGATPPMSSPADLGRDALEADPLQGGSCGDNRCQPPEDCNTCPRDCGNCCGNYRCEPPEDCNSCPQDCGC